MRKQELLDYVRMAVGHYGPMVGLAGWNIEFEWLDPEVEDTYAMCFPTQGRRHAILKVSSAVRDLDIDLINMIVLHELLHAVHTPATDVIRLAVAESDTSQETYDVLWSCFINQIEYMVDQLACSLVDSLPSPPAKT